MLHEWRTQTDKSSSNSLDNRVVAASQISAGRVVGFSSSVIDKYACNSVSDTFRPRLNCMRTCHYNTAILLRFTRIMNVLKPRNGLYVYAVFHSLSYYFDTNGYKKHTTRWNSEREVFYYDILNHFYTVLPGSYRIRWNNAKIRAITPFKVVQGHSRSPILGPIESA